MKKWSWLIKAVLGFVVSAVIMILMVNGLLGGTSEVKLDDLKAIITSISVLVLGWMVFCQLSQTYLRTIRYRILLAADGGERAPIGRMFAVTVIRNMMVDMLPARLGEFVYVALVKRVLGRRFSNGMVSMGASFVFDLIALAMLAIGLFGLSFAAQNSGEIPPWVWLGLVMIGLIAGFGFFYIFPIALQWTHGIRQKLFSWRWLAYLNGLLDEMGEVVEANRKQGKFVQLLVLSLGIRFFKYAGTVFLLYTILNHSFTSVAFSQIGQLFIGVLAGEAAASLPVPAFMSFGTYEAGGTFSLVSLGFSAEAALISVFTVHLISQLIDYSMGMTALFVSWILGWITESKVDAGSGKKRVLIASTVVAFGAAGVVALGFAWKQFQSIQSNDGGLVELSQNSTGISETDNDPPATHPAVKVEQEDPEGFAIWASNRFGNHEIVRYQFGTGELERVTETERSEFRPEISPDGTKIVFMRAMREGITARNLTGWEVVVRDLGTGQEIPVDTDGFHASWAENNEEVVYTKSTNKVLLANIQTGEKTQLIAAGENGIPGGFQFFTPHVNPDTNELVVTIRGSRRTKVIYDLDTFAAKDAPGGCQMNWMPDRQRMIFTLEGGHGGNGFFLTDLDGQNEELFLDPPIAHSHQYFPRVSRDGKWLVYAASAEGHEHDQADYEVFLWRVGDSQDQVLRLSDDPGNDSWPDIHMN